TGLIFETGQVHGRIKENPTRTDAVQAVATLGEVVCDFPFAEPIHRAAWVAALLTPLARFSFKGPAPLFLVDGNTPGVGKGLLLDTIAHILTGEEYPPSHYTQNTEEMRKRVTSQAVAGEQLVFFDNVVGPFGDAVLDLVLTKTKWGDRLLGGNQWTE